MLLRSIDVLHDFYVPQIRAKMDLVPGMETYFWFTPTRTGQFEILCVAYCGLGHPQMRGMLFVDSRQRLPDTGLPRNRLSLRCAKARPREPRASTQ